MSKREVCRCPAYAWPHSLGRGKCDRTSDYDRLDALPARRQITIKVVIAESNGIQLARGDDDFYYVGIGYIPGHIFTSFEDPKTDFCSSAELDIARRYYQLHSGDNK